MLQTHFKILIFEQILSPAYNNLRSVSYNYDNFINRFCYVNGLHSKI